MSRAVTAVIEPTPAGTYDRIYDRTMTGIFAGLCVSLTAAWVAMLVLGGAWIFSG